MRLNQYVASNSKNDINATVDSIFSALVSVCKVSVVTGVTSGAATGDSFAIAHNLGRKPEFFMAQPESACVFTWTAVDKSATNDRVLVLHADTDAVPFVALTLSRFE